MANFRDTMFDDNSPTRKIINNYQSHNAFNSKALYRDANVLQIHEFPIINL